MFPSNVTGTYDGTGAAMTFKLGFVPSRVRIVNFGSTGKEQLEWCRGMPAGSAIKTTNAGRSYITTGGITINGDTKGSTVEQGFTLGTDADVNVSGERFYLEAIRGGPGAQF